MPNRADLIKQATIRARNSWVRYTAVQEKEIMSIFKQTADEIATAIERASVQGKVVSPRLTTLLGNVNAELEALRPRLTGKITRGMGKSVDYGIMTPMRAAEVVAKPGFKVGVGSSFIGADGKIRRYDAKIEAYKDSGWAKIHVQAMDALMRFEPEGETLSSQIWDLAHNAGKTIRNRIRMGVLQGESASRLSRDIRGYLIQPETLRGRVKRLYHPGSGVYKSAYKNAMRVARTEYARAYVEGTYRYSHEKPWINGYTFRTASGDPCPICADLDGTWYPKDTPPPIPVHPHCFCYPEITYKEPEVKKSIEKKVAL